MLFRSHVTVGGRLHHLTGDNDKGQAVRIVSGWYRRANAEVITLGLGDSANDLSMLAAVDRAFLVAKPTGGHHREMTLPGLARIAGAGPVGWNRAILDTLNTRP